MNPWNNFLKLLPSSIRWIGKIQSIDATTGKATIELFSGTPDTQIIIVEGGTGYSEGDYVFIQDRVIVSKATELKTLESSHGMVA